MVFLVSVVLLLGIFLFCFLFSLELKTTEIWFFQRVYLYIWAIGGQKLGILSIRVHSSLLELWNLITFLSFKTSLVMPIISHYDVLRTKIDMWLTISACEVLQQTFLLSQAKNILATRQDYFCNVSYFYRAQSSLSFVVTSIINRHFELLVRLSFCRISIYEDYLFNQNWVKEI